MKNQIYLWKVHYFVRSTKTELVSIFIALNTQDIQNSLTKVIGKGNYSIFGFEQLYPVHLISDDVCKKIYSKMLDIEKNNKNTENSNLDKDSIFKCEICENTYKTEKALKAHKLREHRG